MSDRTPRPLPLIVWLILPPLMLITIWLASELNPELATNLLRKDDIDGGGLVEHLTVILLFPAVWFGWRCATRFRHLLWRPVQIWFFLWAAGAFYFAMEEISWGQWVFGWETPD
ncbi:MAG: hypothetical protein AAF493_26045, partial [Pseudomonadota bacterium]